MAEFFKHLIPSVADAKIISTIATVVLVIVFVRILQGTLGRRVHDTRNRPAVRRLIAFAGIVAALFVISNIFGERLGHFSVAIGVLGAGVAFALQEVIVSIAGWLAILFAGFYKTGDRVQLGGIQGDVIEIGILRTTVLEIGQWISGDLYTGRIVRIANSFVFKEPVFNYTGAFPYIWDEIMIPVRYDSDSMLAREIIERTVNSVTGEYIEHSREAWDKLAQDYGIRTNPRLDPLVTLSATDNWVQFTIRYPVDYKARRITKDRIFTRLVREFDNSGGKVGIASSTFQVVAPSVLDVTLRSAAPAEQP